jgi:hypothetical protein
MALRAAEPAENKGSGGAGAPENSYLLIPSCESQAKGIVPNQPDGPV